MVARQWREALAVARAASQQHTGAREHDACAKGKGPRAAFHGGALRGGRCVGRGQRRWQAEPGSPGDAPAHCSALLPARVANLATAGEALPPAPPPPPPANPAAPRPLSTVSSPTLCAKRNVRAAADRAAQPLKFFWILTSWHCHVVCEFQCKKC